MQHFDLYSKYSILITIFALLKFLFRESKFHPDPRSSPLSLSRLKIHSSQHRTHYQERHLLSVIRQSDRPDFFHIPHQAKVLVIWIPHRLRQTVAWAFSMGDLNAPEVTLPRGFQERLKLHHFLMHRVVIFQVWSTSHRFSDHVLSLVIACVLSLSPTSKVLLPRFHSSHLSILLVLSL